MGNGIVSSLITLVGTIFVAIISYVGNRKGSKDASEANAKLIAYRLQELEKKVNEHNNLISRVFKLEGRMDEAEHDIRDLKSKGG